MPLPEGLPGPGAPGERLEWSWWAPDWAAPPPDLAGPGPLLEAPDEEGWPTFEPHPSPGPWPPYPQPRLECPPLPEPGPWASPSALIARVLAAASALPQGFERLRCLDGLTFEPLPHQRVAVQRALGPLRGRALLADEVGLGKTVEAGLVWRELALRQEARRVLVLAPPTLLRQWQEELAEKFGLAPQLLRRREDWVAPAVLASLDLAKRPAHATEAWAQAFDLVIVDEAHRLHQPQTLAHRLVKGLSTRRLLLLTATPLRNHLGELHALAELLEPGLWGALPGFTQSEALEGDWRVARDPEGLRRRLGELMIRHRRAELGRGLPPRRVGTWWLQRPPLEAALEEDAAELLAHGEQGAAPGALLVLATLRRALASSPAAAASMLAKLAQSPGRPAAEAGGLAGLAEAARHLGPGRKVEAALAHLLGLPEEEPVVCFTEFRATQAALVGAVQATGRPAQALHGGMGAQERAQALARWRRLGGPLVATEAGAEGHNWQHAATVLNLELPWNPMRLEQRVGRVHRLGQTRTVTLLHLVAQGSFEAEVHELLATKLQLFGLVVGELEPILGGDRPVAVEAELARLAWRPDRAEGMARLGAQLAEALARQAAAEAATEAFWREATA